MLYNILVFKYLDNPIKLKEFRQENHNKQPNLNSKSYMSSISTPTMPMLAYLQKLNECLIFASPTQM